MHGVTIRDVASEASVSIATVSYVLNNSRPVREDTRLRVLAAVQRLGYQPNITARNLQASRTRLLGCPWRPVANDQFNPILDHFLQAICEAAAASGYRTLAFPATSDAEELVTYSDMLRVRQVDGFVVSNTNYDDPRIRYLMQSGVSFVAFGRSNPDWKFPWVDVDGAAGMQLATAHLLAQGHRRIACLVWPEGSLSGYYRQQGYLMTMAEARLTVPVEWMPVTDNTHDHAYARTQSLLELPDDLRPTAIQAMSDLMAMGIINAVADAGLTVGRDVAVVGFDDAPVARYLRPPLTSLAQPIAEIGQHMVRMLIQLIQGEKPEPCPVLLAPALIIRESSAHPWHGA